MSLETLRLSTSNSCELSCGYCKHTQAKKYAGAWPAVLPQAQNLVLPCNSFYSDKVENEDFSSFAKVSIELHFLTLSLERHQERLERLAQKNYEWIVHIDHLDSHKIRDLQIWDEQVVEYRIIPSKLYPAALYLKKLPDFVQRKIKWQFMQQDEQNPAFAPLEDYPQITQYLKTAPLHHFAMSDTQWLNTWAAPAEFVRGDNWSVIDSHAYPSSDWPLQLLHADTEYVGYFSAPIPKETSAQLPESLLYYADGLVHAKLRKLLSFYSPNSEKIYFLENFLVKKEIWAMYLKQYRIYDHWTWSEFIKANHIHMEALEPADSYLTEKTIRRQAQQHYLKTLDQKFYENYFFFLQDRGRAGKFFYWSFAILFALISLLPSLFYEKAKRTVRATGLWIEDRVYTFLATHEELKKILTFVFSKTYWALHRVYWGVVNTARKIGWKVIDAFWALYELGWKVYEMGWRVVDAFWVTYEIGWKVRSFLGKVYGHAWKLKTILWKAYDLGWRLMDVFWFTYQKFWAPILFFTFSLFDFPQEFKRQPFFKALYLKGQFIARKFAWLALKAVGKR